MNTGIKRSIVIVCSLCMLFLMMAGFLAAYTAADGGNVSEKTDISITEFEIQNESHETLESIRTDQYYYMKLKWDASAYGSTLLQGDYFDLTLPDEFWYPENASTTDFDIFSPEGDVVARAHVSPNGHSGGGTVRVTFTDFVEGRKNVNGTMYLSSHLVSSKVQTGQTNTFTVSVGVNEFTLDINVDESTQSTLNPEETLSKWYSRSGSTDDYVMWSVRINYAGRDLHEVVITDNLTSENGDLSGMHYITDQFYLSERVINEYGSTVEVVQTWDSAALGDRLRFNEDSTSFTLDLGDIGGRQYMLYYYTTYVPGMNLRNNVYLNSTERTWHSTSSYTAASSGGTGSGDHEETTTEEPASDETGETTAEESTTEEPASEETTSETTSEEQTTEEGITSETTTVETAETDVTDATTSEQTSEEGTIEAPTAPGESISETTTKETKQTVTTPTGNNNNKTGGTKSDSKSDKSKNSPSTGDNGRYILYLAAFAISGSICLCTLLWSFDKKKQ